jgi:ubiquinone biosynthesis protein UbiJ
MLLARLEETFNRNVANSRKAQVLCRQLDGRTLSLDVVGTSLKFFLSVRDGSIVLDTRPEKNADASLAATPVSLLALVGPEAERGMRGGAIHIEGDAEVAQKFRELLMQARPDFEEELSRVIGDVAAHRVANFARGFLDWGRKAADSMGTNVAEFLQEEGRDVPTRVEVDEFLAAVDRLREDTDRLEAQLERSRATRKRRP